MLCDVVVCIVAERVFRAGDDAAGLTPEDAFAVLGDETRLNVVRVLWSAGASHEYDDVDDTASTMPYSELRRRVGVEDDGRFNYHLSKLLVGALRPRR